MSRISAITPANAEGKVKTLLDGVQKAVGMVPNLYRVAAQSPVALEGLLALTNALGNGVLDKKLREQIAIAVAERNGCDYCLSAHTLLGKHAGVSQSDLAAARTANAGDAQFEAALRFVTEVVDRRGQVTDVDLAGVRGAGFDDGEIVELVAQAALNIFTNTLNNVALTEIDFPVVHTTHSVAA